MSTSPVAEYRETEADLAARARTLKRNLIKIGIAAVVAAWGFVSAGWTGGTLFTLVLVVLTSVVLFMNYLVSLNMPSLVALVDSGGLKLRTRRGTIQDIVWPDVRYIDALDETEQKRRSIFFVSFNKSDGGHECLPLPLQSMPKPISECFVETIEHYRPNLYASWQDQLSQWSSLGRHE